MRRDQLCPGPGDCPYVYVENPQANADSPPCEGCPLTLLEEYLASPAGQLIRATFNLEFALEAGVMISLKEITYPEFLLLRILSEERNRFREEAPRTR